MQRYAFTLIEILATLLVFSFGLLSVIGMVQYASRVSAESQSNTTALVTASSVVLEPEPLGLVADIGDANGDDWWAEGPIEAPPDAEYQFKVYGWLNGYYLIRTESSTLADIIDEQTRWATITVEVFSGSDPVTAIQRQLLRRTKAP